jgi:hypothetical protein
MVEIEGQEYATAEFGAVVNTLLPLLSNSYRVLLGCQFA